MAIPYIGTLAAGKYSQSASVDMCKPHRKPERRPRPNKKPTAVVAAKRRDGQIMIREFDYLDKTKDLANLGAHGSANRPSTRVGICSGGLIPAGAQAASRKKVFSMPAAVGVA
jgi:hypothetical protein